MLFITVGQWRVFLWMVAAGAVIGAWYAATALLRRLLAAGALLSLAADLCFGLGAAAIFCLFLYAANFAALRLYAVLAAALGFTLFALGAFPAGRHIIAFIKRRLLHIFDTIVHFRWIKVIFR